MPNSPNKKMFKKVKKKKRGLKEKENVMHVLAKHHQARNKSFIAFSHAWWGRCLKGMGAVTNSVS